MKKYDYIIVIAFVTIICLQVVYIKKVYHNYINDKITGINGSMLSALGKELDLRMPDKLKKERHIYYKLVYDMTSEVMDSLMRLNWDDDILIDLNIAEGRGIRNTIDYIVFQLEQDKVLQNDLALNLRTLDSIYVAESDNKFRHTFLLYDEDKLQVDLIGNLKTDKSNYSSVFYPIGTKGMQYLQIKARIPLFAFIKHEYEILILSVCIILILIFCIIYQLIEIRRKNNLLLKREASVNGTIHNMRAPLNSIISTLGWFKTKTEDTNIQELIDKNQAIVRHLIYNIESLLVTARNDRQRIILNKTKVDVCTVVEMIKEELSSLYKGKFSSIDIINNLPNKYRINADAMYLESVIRNLIENSLKFSDDDVSVKITFMIVQKSLKVSVKDNGWGIAPKYQKKLFRQFYQVPRRKVKKREGLGIGLAQAKCIIDEHGGDIHVKSSEDKGSVFSFTIPV